MSSRRCSPSPTASSGPAAKVVHIDLNAYEIAKNHPVDLGLAAYLKQALRALAGVLERRL